jgi:hypothetical protein
MGRAGLAFGPHGTLIDPGRDRFDLRGRQRLGLGGRRRHPLVVVG